MLGGRIQPRALESFGLGLDDEWCHHLLVVAGEHQSSVSADLEADGSTREAKSIHFDPHGLR